MHEQLFPPTITNISNKIPFFFLVVFQKKDLYPLKKCKRLHASWPSQSSHCNRRIPCSHLLDVAFLAAAMVVAVVP